MEKERNIHKEKHADRLICTKFNLKRMRYTMVSLRGRAKQGRRNLIQLKKLHRSGSIRFVAVSLSADYQKYNTPSIVE